MHTCMSCFIYVNFGKCKLDLAKISPSLAKMVESGVIEAPRVLDHYYFDCNGVSWYTCVQIDKIMCLNVYQKYTKLFGGKILV